MRLLVDDMANTTADRYHAWPQRVYIIDAAGHIAFNCKAPGEASAHAVTATLDALLQKP